MDNVLISALVIIISILMIISFRLRSKRFQKQLKSQISTHGEDISKTENNTFSELNYSNPIISPKAYLVIVDGNPNIIGARIPLFENDISVGRDASMVDFQIDDSVDGYEGTISRKHFLISYKNRGYFIIDSDSTNGTFVNGKQILPQHPTLLSNDTIIEIGVRPYAGASISFQMNIVDSEVEKDGTLTRKNVEKILEKQGTINNRTTYQYIRPTGFISYRRSSSAMLAQLIAEKLEQEYRIDTFVDARKVDGAGPFPQRLLKEIETHSVFVCLLSRTTLDSDWVMKEISHAYHLGKPMIPIFQESYVPLPENDLMGEAVKTLLNSEGIHIFDEKNIYIKEAIDKLALMIRSTTASLQRRENQ